MYYLNEEVDVLIFIEHLDRELDSAIKIMGELEERHNVSVALASIEFDLFDAFVKFSPKLICLPYCKSGLNKVVKLFKKKLKDNVRFINLNYEQLLSNYTKENKRPKDYFAKNELIHFCWGNDFKEYLIESGTRLESIFITGKPEVSLLMSAYENNEIRSKMKQKLAMKQKIDMNKKWIFIPFNDGLIFEDDDRIQAGIERGSRKKESFVLKKHMEKSIFEILKWFVKFSEFDTEEDFLIIIRPHPSVTTTQYTDVFKEMFGEVPKGIHISRDYSIKEWLISSDVCITNYSTVAVESSAIGVPTYIAEPFKRPRFADTDWIKNFPVLKEYKDFRDVITKDDFIIQDLKGVVTNFIYTEENSIHLTARIISSLLEERNKNNQIQKSEFIWSFLSDPLRLIRSKIRDIEMRYSMPYKVFTTLSLEYDYMPYKKVIERKKRLIMKG